MPGVIALAHEAALSAGSDNCTKDVQCTCKSVFDYLNCSGGPELEPCGLFAEHCQKELEVECSHNETTCMGKFHQTFGGTMGLSIDTEKLAENTFCGPHGKCLGKLEIKASIHRPESGTRLECKLPKVPGAPEEDAAAWLNCSAEVMGDTGECTIHMVPELARGSQLEGSCWLTNGDKGSRLTRSAHFAVRNRYK